VSIFTTKSCVGLAPGFNPLKIFTRLAGNMET